MAAIIERTPRNIDSRHHGKGRHIIRAPGPVEIIPSDDSVTLEQVILKTCGAESLRDFPSSVIQSIIVIDALHFPLSLQDRESLLAYSFYVLGAGSFRYIKTYMRVTEDVGINSLLDPVMDNPDLVKAYDKIDVLSGILRSFIYPFSKIDIDRRKNIANEVIQLMAQGQGSEEIIARRAEILDKTNPHRVKV